MKIVATLCLAGLLATGCASRQPSAEQLLEVDRNFSAYSKENGVARAFVEFAHPDAVLLRKNSLPITGREAIIRLYEPAKNTPLTLTWEPVSGQIAQSGELGFTYGIYTAAANGDTTRGTYVSVWKKDRNGKWKYILDTGNEGIKPPVPGF